MQCEWIALSRAIPPLLRWFIGPFVTAVPRESIAFTLGAAREHLTQHD